MTGKKLTFEALNIGDRFISFPIDGDNDGHGGFAGVHYVFMKTNLVIENDEAQTAHNSVSMCTGHTAFMPNEMLVIKIQ